ncbi:MAG: hypothetical protein IPP67_06460 [Rhodospirillaceae bacterium]|nr:hypothetical protein [Rhodospirillaceae bacterium]
MKILIAIFLAIGISLPALAQVPGREEKKQYIQSRCDELQKENLLRERKGCEIFFGGRFTTGYMYYPPTSYIISHPGEKFYLLMDEYKFVEIDSYCDGFFGISPWFGYRNDPGHEKSYEACVSFYTKKKQEALRQ